MMLDIVQELMLSYCTAVNHITSFYCITGIFIISVGLMLKVGILGAMGLPGMCRCLLFGSLVLGSLAMFLMMNRNLLCKIF